MSTTLAQVLTSSLTWHFFIAISVYSLIINTIFGHKTYWRSLSPWRGVIRFFKKVYRLVTRGNLKRAKRSTTISIAAESKKLQKNKSCLENLDDNVFIYILAYLHPSEVLRVARVSKHTHAICESPQLWFLFQEQVLQDLEQSTSLKAVVLKERCMIGALKHEYEKQSAKGRYFFCHFVIIRMLLDNEDIVDRTNTEHAAIGSEENASICRLLVEGDVYDLTQFQWEHPGGEFILGEWRGKDASKQFRIANHSTFAMELSRNYLLWSSKKWIGRSSYPKFVSPLYASLVTK